MVGYAVHCVGGALRASAPQAAFGVVFAGVAWLVLDQRLFAGFVLVAVVGSAILSGVRGWNRLRVDARGIRLSFPIAARAGSLDLGAGYRTVAWRDVRRLVLAPDRVQVVLRADAPMPPWLTSRVFDPNRPDDGVSYARDVPGLDPLALDAAVRQLATHVAVQHAASG